MSILSRLSRFFGKSSGYPSTKQQVEGFVPHHLGPHPGVDPRKHDVNAKVARGIVPRPSGPLPGPPRDIDAVGLAGTPMNAPAPTLLVNGRVTPSDQVHPRLP